MSLPLLLGLLLPQNEQNLMSLYIRYNAYICSTVGGEYSCYGDMPSCVYYIHAVVGQLEGGYQTGRFYFSIVKEIKLLSKQF